MQIGWNEKYKHTNLKQIENKIICITAATTSALLSVEQIYFFRKSIWERKFWKRIPIFAWFVPNSRA